VTGIMPPAWQLEQKRSAWHVEHMPSDWEAAAP
jgi:hypothetical protein